MGAIARYLGWEREPLARVEPRLLARSTDSTTDALAWGDWDGWSVRSAAGMRVGQSTAMQVSAVYACVSYISYDLAKLGAQIYSGARKGARAPARSHFLRPLLRRPAPWLTWFEFCAMLQMSVLLRGNGYAVILRDSRGTPQMLVPINPDRVALWEAPDGGLFYMVTRQGLHELWVLRNEPLLIPAEDIFHLKGLTANGLLGLSPISLEREAIGLALAQEQLASRWAADGAQPRGVLTTEQKLSPEAAARMAKDWQQRRAGLLNAGKTAILEQGLKWQPLSMTSQDMEFLASRQFQIEEIARIFRVPIYMLASSKTGSKGTVTQQAQEYLNYSLSTWIEMWEQRLEFTFDLDDAELFVDFDEDRLLQADIATRYAAHRVSTGGVGWKAVNEIRAAEGEGPVEGGDTVFRPVNTAPIDSDVFQGMADPNDPTLPGIGSDQTGQGAEGGGRPPDDGGDASAQEI